jgi:DMSO/TMAO reductase YedYZ molybdopterin-dependent catalytic subunit
MTSKPGLLSGLLIGGALAVPAAALSSAANALAGLPYLPAFVFGLMRDLAPGDIVPRFIRVMSDVILALQIGRLDTVAKTTEEVIAFIAFVALGALCGLITFAVLNAVLRQRADLAPGLLLGAVLTVGAVLALNHSAGLIVSPAVLTLTWTTALMLLFGLALSFVYNTLRFAVRQHSAAADAAAPSVEGIDRREFLIRVGGSAAVITVVGAGVASLLQTTEQALTTAARATPGADGLAPAATPEVTAVSGPPSAGEFVAAPGTRAKITPLEEHYRIDINSFLPEVAEAGYTLPFTTRLNGDFETLAELTLADLRSRFAAVTTLVTMSCISNRVGGDLIGTIDWTGARLRDVLAEIDIPASATHLRITSADNFDEFVSLEAIRSDERILLCYDWAGQPLTQKHGFPLRVFIPDVYGMKQPKWITGMEFTDSDSGGYWVRRGWDSVARVNTTSVIDTVAVSSIYTGADGVDYVPVGGIAWSGNRGISRVTVRFDGGEAQDALLDAPLSEHTWVLWRIDLPVVEGRHTLQVQAFEGDGTAQVGIPADTFPSGATGLHTYTGGLS